MDAAQLALRAGVDAPVYWHSTRRLARLARAEFGKLGTHSLGDSIGSERSLVLVFLRSAPPRPCLCGYRCAPDCHLLLHRNGGKNQPSCRLAVRPLRALGRVRVGAELCNLAAESDNLQLSITANQQTK